jgi:hypothetical protein
MVAVMHAKAPLFLVDPLEVLAREQTDSFKRSQQIWCMVHKQVKVWREVFS